MPQLTTKHWWLYGAWWLWMIAQFAVVHWSLIALPRGWTTTSQFMSEVGPIIRFVIPMAVGSIVGFVAGHFWWPVTR